MTGAHRPSTMRKLGLTLLLVVTGAASALACSTTNDESETSAHDLTDEDLAKAALKIMGAPQIQREAGNQSSCSFTGCHSINPITLKGWQDQYKAAMDILESERPN